ncbi:hypothetical protein D3C74_473640 [compost metagenome]
MNLSFNTANLLTNIIWTLFIRQSFMDDPDITIRADDRRTPHFLQLFLQDQEVYPRCLLLLIL